MLLQLLDALGLVLGQCAFRLGLAVFIVTHDVATFPADILSQSDGPLTVFTFLCHMITPLL